MREFIAIFLLWVTPSLFQMIKIEFDLGFKDCEYYALSIPFWLVFYSSLRMFRKVNK